MTMKWNHAWLLTATLALGAQTTPGLQQSQAIRVGETIVEDEEMAKVIAPYANKIKGTFDVVLTECPKGLFRGRSGDESLLGYWVADLMRAKASDILGAPVAFAITNSGGLRANMRPGTVKVGTIYEIMPFENELVIVEFTGAELIQIVKEGILRRNGEPLSGMRVSLSGPVGAPKYEVTWADGTLISPTKTYKIATTDYLAANGDGGATIRNGRKLFTTGVQLRQLLLDECARLGQAKQPLLPPQANRYAFTPDILEALKDKKLKW
jgi:2',3'-cyclic-nucleotide 2'-phosphodiesterase (5'-nucleotidase family)